MFEELSAVEESVKEILINLMMEKVIPMGIQDSSYETSASLPIDYSWIRTKLRLRK
jgi:hypothetical protein